jgi:hypothetical protein
MTWNVRALFSPASQAFARNSPRKAATSVAGRARCHLSAEQRRPQLRGTSPMRGGVRPHREMGVLLLVSESTKATLSYDRVSRIEA